MQAWGQGRDGADKIQGACLTGLTEGGSTESPRRPDVDQCGSTGGLTVG